MNEFEKYIQKIEKENLDFLLSIGFAVRPIDYKNFYVFSSAHKINKRMELVKQRYPKTTYEEIPSKKSCLGDYLIKFTENVNNTQIHFNHFFNNYRSDLQ